MMVFPATAARFKSIATRFFCQQNFNFADVRCDRTCRSLLRRDKDAERSFLETELDWAIADELAIELNRHRLVALHPQSRRLKILNLRNANFRTEHDVLEIFDNLEIAEAFENDHVQLPVVNDGMFKKWKRSAIKPAVSHQHERSFLDRRVVGLNRQPGWLTSRDLRRGNQIT